MNCLLLYYTGTFNTRFLTEKLGARLVSEGWSVTKYELDPLNNERLDLSSYDIIGLGYPIYGFCAPYPFLKFIRAQKFPRGMRIFVYKDSGETEHANDASSKYLLRKLRRDGALLTNEYHFLMPYNIHFRFEDKLVKEMLMMDDRLLDILVYELVNGIGNSRRYRIWPRIVSSVVSLPMYIAGDVNSFFYRVDMDKCSGCGLCISRCPMQNIYRDRKGTVRFRHRCLMCMRCSFFCPKDAIHIGFLEAWGWKINGGYDLHSIAGMPQGEPVITEKTTGFFKCYREKYAAIDARHKELFGN